MDELCKRTSIAMIAALCILFAVSAQALGQQQIQWKDTVEVEWEKAPTSGTIEVLNGRVEKITILKGKGKIKGTHFQFASSGSARIAINLDSIQNNPGPGATLLTVQTGKRPFSFFTRDVSTAFPVYIPIYGVVVLPGKDNRSYTTIKDHIASLKHHTKLEKIQLEPEASFASAEHFVRRQYVPTWLGISRDFRIFQLTESMPGMPREASIITPKYAASNVNLPETKNNASAYLFVTGRGQGVELNTKRWLDDGVLPVLHSVTKDEDVQYHSISFVALEKSSLAEQGPRGTDFLVADNYSHGHMFTKQQEGVLKHKLQKAFDTREETVFYFRSVAENKGSAPVYAWFKTARPGSGWYEQYPYTYDSATGLSTYAPDKVFCISTLNGKPLPNEEIAILLKPGEKAVFEFFLPHTPVSYTRAIALSKQSFDEKWNDCKSFWKAKLKSGAQIHLPEQRIENMLQAGLLHLDLITYGTEPDSTLAPSIGVYSPIGTESAPIIQFYASMGWHDIAKRSLQYFLDKQHDDGMIQNFGGYMVETGAALWSMGEYYRYTNDKAWVEKIKPQLLKSCDFLLAWRNRNKKENLRGKGYGMIDGKVADPEDQFHQFMLNGYAYLGCIRVAEMLAGTDDVQSERIKKEAEAWRADIRESFFNSMAHSPVIPMGNGNWLPTVAPWPEMTGPRALYIKPENFFSHATFTTADALLGPLYLVFCEVLDVNEPASAILLNYHSEMFYQHNVAFSQPYYSRHNWVQAKLGMVKPFLQTYYNAFAALADRETFTFWEHFYHVSVHKTHEEAWFLMETRWMLYMEEGSTLHLLRTIPRNWMEDGKIIELKNVSSYYGPLNVKVNSAVSKGYIEAAVECKTGRGLKSVNIRLPHPDGKKPIKITGGVYNEETETVSIPSFNGTAHVKLEY
jgi:hypothetical protein